MLEHSLPWTQERGKEDQCPASRARSRSLPTQTPPGGVLGDLAGVDRWIPGVTMVEVAGLTRRCIFADGHTQREEILDYSPATRSYRYTIDGGLPVRDNQGRFAVEPATTGAVLSLVDRSLWRRALRRPLSRRARPPFRRAGDYPNGGVQ